MSADSSLRLLVLDLHVLWAMIAIGVTIGFLWLIKDVLVTLLFVAVLTFLGAPIVARLSLRMPRWVASLLFVLGALLVLAAMVSLVVPPLLGDFVRLFESLPTVWRKLAEWVEFRLNVALPISIADLSSEASRELLDQLMPFAEGGGGLVKSGAAGVLRGAAGAAGFIGQLFLIPVLAFFLLSEWPRVKEMLHVFVPHGAQGIAGHYAPRVERTLGKLVRGQLFVASLMAMVYVVGLSVAGVPYALAISVIAGAAYLIPFASASVCMVLAAAFSLLEMQTAALSPIIGAAVTCVIVQLVESYFLTPRIVGKEAGLSPLGAVLAVLLGGSAAGFLGVLFALPMGAVLALILREESRRRGGILVETVTQNLEANA